MNTPALESTKQERHRRRYHGELDAVGEAAPGRQHIVAGFVLVEGEPMEKSNEGPQQPGREPEGNPHHAMHQRIKCLPAIMQHQPDGTDGLLHQEEGAYGIGLL
jgi:hypothetical protein